MERPYGTQDKITAEAARRQAQLRAKRAAAVARRAAAARRRAVLTTALLVISAVAWVVVGLTSMAVTAAVVPSLLLVGVLGLGRRAVVQGQAADAAWEQQQRRLQSELSRPASGSTRITGRALHPSDSHTEAVPHVAPQRRAADTSATPSADAGSAPSASGETTDAPGSEASSEAPAAASATDDEGSSPAQDGERSSSQDADGESAEGWSPVPVPRPTYTTKATAPRREPVPLVVEDPAATAPAAVTSGAQEPEAAVSTPPAIDLDAVLARRRAVGE